MTTKRQERRALLRAEQLIIDLKTLPRVPQYVRDEARAILRHLPLHSQHDRQEEAVYPLVPPVGAER